MAKKSEDNGKYFDQSDKHYYLLQTLIDDIPDHIYVKDSRGRFIIVNKAQANFIGGRKPGDLIGKTDFDFYPQSKAKEYSKDEKLVMKSGNPIIDKMEESKFLNNEFWVSSSKIPWYDKNGNIMGIMGISRDITKRKKAEEEVEYLSFHDGLTGLYNRAYFEEELRRLNTGRQLPLTLVMGDVNGLKLINDAYGHANGDMLLKGIADILRKSFRREDIVVRWGGDEFVSILPKTGAEDAKNIVGRIQKLCSERSTTAMPLNISLGIATKKKSAENVEDIMKKAEERMYKNKISESTSINETLIFSLKENLKKGGHRSDSCIKKMENYAILLGKRLKLSKVKLEELRLLLNLHNIGKLALADEIMSKKRRLTKEEWKIIKELPKIGYRIAESSKKLQTIAEPILAHHEWYNGSGYPRGIQGEEIPILSRISSLINSYEAMISNRPYRKKMTKKEAIKEIKRCSSTQFDPKIANIFLRILKEEKE